ncbi:twin-arginine translocase subunit TatC [Anaerolineales bacterium HSG6]|nr:twin-arginine translocase subunit TatC [Anaerolineales bacterium HSG6]MDM8532642.1 twin-arginine translocase subunit TatC [Anaerolineales bacterium HSG25]
MSLFDHLDELRSRLVKSALAILICTIVATIFTTEIIKLLIEPYGIELRTHGPTEGISTYFRVAFMTGFTIAVPFVFYHFLMFILPGLEKNEKKYIAMSLPAASLLFLTGVGFAWFIMIPAAIGFLSNWQPEIFVQEWQSREYIPFVTSMIFWIGVSFETPLVIFIMAKVGLVTPQFLIKQWRFAVVIIAIAAAIITPTVDPFNMGLVMLPLFVLYGISILLSYFA